MATITHNRRNATLYAVAWVVDEDAEELDYDADEVLMRLQQEEYWEPEGWREYALKMWPDGPREGEHWPDGYKPFFWPSSSRLYTTRKAAEGRRDLINHWGGNTIVVAAEVNWVPLDQFDAKVKRERLEAQRQAIDAELAELGNECTPASR